MTIGKLVISPADVQMEKRSSINPKVAFSRSDRLEEKRFDRLPGSICFHLDFPLGYFAMGPQMWVASLINQLGTENLKSKKCPVYCMGFWKDRNRFLL